MFTFNFNNEVEFSENILGVTGENKEKSIQWYESKEMKMPSGVADSIKKIPENHIITLDYNCGLKFLCLSATKVINELKGISVNENICDIVKADEKHSDLVPGEYEGGLKIWECTKDMVTYFMKNEIPEGTNTLNGKSVLDLGCGSGILGIMCLLRGASVTFQDYNQEVLETMTIPNIFLNCNNVIKENIRLFSGDWSSFADLIINKHGRNNQFDYILTSETIYNRDNYKKIIMIIKTLLKPDGACFVGAKMNYFGVGGSLKEFEGLLQEQGMVTSLCWEATEGVTRGILKVEFQ